MGIHDIGLFRNLKFNYQYSKAKQSYNNYYCKLVCPCSVVSMTRHKNLVLGPEKDCELPGGYEVHTLNDTSCCITARNL